MLPTSAVVVVPVPIVIAVPIPIVTIARVPVIELVVGRGSVLANAPQVLTAGHVVPFTVGVPIELRTILPVACPVMVVRLSVLPVGIRRTGGVLVAHPSAFDSSVVVADPSVVVAYEIKDLRFEFECMRWFASVQVGGLFYFIVFVIARDAHQRGSVILAFIRTI